jgi:hypothetical protein
LISLVALEVGETKVADRDEVMLTELDHQLNDIREQCAGVANKASFLVSICALAAALLAVDLERIKTGEILAFVALGAAVMAGIAVLAPWLAIGPENSNLTLWFERSDEEAQIAALFAAKLIFLASNKRRFDRMLGILCLQGILVLVAVVASLVVTAGR